jgi:peptide/nickel transport system substrate-binding protein
MSLMKSVRGPAAAVAAAAIALSSLPSVGVAQDPVTFRIGITQAPSDTGLNPYLATLGADYTLFADMYDLLIEFGPNLEPAPGLAESWDVSDDGLTWTYHLRDGVTWHDGTPFTAEDARFQLQYIFDSHDPAYTGPAAPGGNDLLDGNGDPNPDGAADNPLSLFDSYLDLDGGFENTRITGIEAPDERTLVITTSEPIITLSQMYVPVLPKHIWENITFEQAAVENLLIEQAVGTGPFKMLEWNPKQAIVLEANDAYWAGAPHIDQLVYQFFDNDEAQVQALINGDVDFLDNFPPTLAQTLMDAENVEVHISKGSDFGELGFNSWNPDAQRFVDEGCADCPKGPTTGSMGDPWLTMPEVRGALAGLLDKKALIQQALNGFGDPAVSIVSPLNPIYAYTPPPGDPVTFPEYTDEAGQAEARAAAEQRFRDAMGALGFTDTDGDGILNVPDTEESRAFDPEGAGQNWSLRLFARDDDEEDKLAAELMETWFEAAGVDIDYQPIPEDPNLYAATYPSRSNADMDLYIWGWGPDPDPDFILSIFDCGQINNWQDANYCDPAYDETYRQQRVQTDLAARAEIVKAMQDKVYHESPYAVLWYINGLEAYRSDRFEGFNQVPSSDGALWSTYGLGPWGSRISVGPIGAAGGTPPPLPAD